MITPNHKPTPPPGYRLLLPEKYGEPLPAKPMYSDDGGSHWYLSANEGNLPHAPYIYAIPITPTVPATGDTTNEKGGEQPGVIHDLKTWPEYYDAILRGDKTFEIRKNDRNFQIGDTLVLRRFDPIAGEYTGACHACTVTYLTAWDQKPGNIVMAIKPL